MIFLNVLKKKSNMNSNDLYQQKLWGGRFKENVSSISEKISESISFDSKLYSFDIQASKSHANMLGAQNIIPKTTSERIVKALSQIEEEIKKGEFIYSYALEDIHTHIEKRLIELIGEDGKRLHTGRSRNDQVAVDTHLYLMTEANLHYRLMMDLLSKIVDIAEKNVDSIWVGYTHLQVAQPISLAHYLLAYFWKFFRDIKFLRFALDELKFSPLGAAALAGPNYPLDTSRTSKELGFTNNYPNSIDAISSRDYQLSYHFFASRLFIHLSQICEDIILYNSTEFGYLTLGDQVTTGSSIMPQKKNPDIPELLRGKSARVIGNLISLLVNLKSLPQTYNRDLQEDKVYLFDTCEQVYLGISGLIEILNYIQFHPDKTENSLNKGFAQATDLADYLVSTHKISFREAHEISGAIVLYAESSKKTLIDLEDEELSRLLPKGIALPKDFFNIRKSIERKDVRGGTAPRQIKQQIKEAREGLKNLE